jgi:hypothetical protein
MTGVADAYSRIACQAKRMSRRTSASLGGAQIEASGLGCT